MDEHRFDRLARHFAEPASRRALLRRLTGLAVALVLPSSRALAQGTCQPAQPCEAGVGVCDAELAIDGSCICIQAESAMTCRRDTCSADGDCSGGQVCTQVDCGDGLGRCKTPCSPPTQATTVPTCPDGQTSCNGHCADLSSDLVNCGACGNQCSFGGESNPQICANGTCRCPNQYPLFCNGTCLDPNTDPQNCGGCGIACPGGSCVNSACAASATSTPPAVGTATIQIVSWNCSQMPDLGIEPPANPPFFGAHPVAGCASADGAVFTVTADTGTTVGSCTTQTGYCAVDASGASGTLTVTETMAPAGYTAPAPQQVTIAASGVPPLVMINLLAATAPVAAGTASAALGKLPTTGQLAYAIKQNGHWDIWLRDFATGKDSQLTTLPDSDQWAPAWSHDGKRLAYLSDQTDGTNQIWLMGPDGTGQRQVSNYTGSESIVYVAWSSDDQSFIVTLQGDQAKHLVKTTVSGGNVAAYVPPSSSFASTGGKGVLVYTANSETNPGIILADEAHPTSGSRLFDGDAPNLTPDGNYVTFHQGAVGQRQIILYKLKLPGGPLPSVPAVAGDATNPVWSPQHTTVAFVVDQGGVESVRLYQLYGDVTTLPTPPHDKIWYLAWRP